MDCPCCVSCTEYVEPPRPRVSPWIPIALIVTVLGAASLASAMSPESREARTPVATAARGSAL